MATYGAGTTEKLNDLIHANGFVGVSQLGSLLGFVAHESWVGRFRPESSSEDKSGFLNEYRSKIESTENGEAIVFTTKLSAKKYIS